MASKGAKGDKREGKFLPETDFVNEVTSRTIFSRKVVIEEEFSESEFSFTTSVGQQKGTTDGGLSGRKANNVDMFNVQISSTKKKQPYSQPARMPNSETHQDIPGTCQLQTQSSSSLNVPRKFQSTVPESEMETEEQKHVQRLTSRKKTFKNTVSKLNDVLSTGRLPGHPELSSSCPRTGGLSFQTAMRDGNKLLNPRRKSFSVDGLREFQITSLESCLLYANFKPLLSALKAAGIFYVKDTKNMSQFESGSSRGKAAKEKVIRNLHVAYCCVVFLIFVTNFILSFWTLVSIENFRLTFETTFALTWCILWLESCLISLVCLVTCATDSRNLTALLCHVEKVCYKDRIIPYQESLSKFLLAFFCLSCVDIFAAFAINMYALFFNDSLIAMMGHLWHYLADDTTSVAYVIFRIIVLVSVTLCKASSVLNTSLFAVITYILYKEFVSFCRSLAAKITLEGDFPCNLEKFRLNHEARCKLVETTNNLFKVSINVPTTSELNIKKIHIILAAVECIIILVCNIIISLILIFTVLSSCGVLD